MSTVLEYKCPCCGGAISFDSTLQKMKCPYCDTEFETETLRQYDEELKNVRPDRMDWETAQGSEWQDAEAERIGVYTCNSCGGEIVADKTTAATSCPFCGNPVVFTGNLSGELKPDYIIPFKLDKKAATEGFKAHLKGKRLLPKLFKRDSFIEEVKGIYVPFWLFGAKTDADMRYRTTRVRTWSDSRYIYTETRHYSIYRAGTMEFGHVPVDGSSKMPDALMESIEPYDYTAAVDFQTAFLSGYLADKYDVGKEQTVGRANERIRTSVTDTFRNTVSDYATIVPEHSSIDLQAQTVRYALLPVWMLTATWKDQKYVFAMNGQTGKFVGDLPLDRGAYWRWLLAIGGIIAAVVFLILLGRSL